MRRFFTMLMAAAILCTAAAAVRAEDGPDEKAPPKSKEKFDRVAFIKLQIKFHRTMADLLEEEIADEPNEEKIAELRKEVRELRKKMFEMRPPMRRRPGRPGGPGDRGPGGPGMGPGMGPGEGPGMGPPPDWDDDEGFDQDRRPRRGR
ncbi:MAG: hypothetical protein JW959_00345 [Pirellulales bacterium]|nr:hypothetical protein [Pirellulales bacterium]